MHDTVQMNAIHRTDRSVGMGDYRVRFRRVSRWVRDVSSAHALRPTQRVKCWATLCRPYGTSASRAMLSRHFRAGLSHSAASRLDPIAMEAGYPKRSNRPKCQPTMLRGWSGARSESPRLFLQPTLELEPFGEAVDPMIGGKDLLVHSEAVATLGVHVQFDRFPGVRPLLVQSNTLRREPE